MAQRFIDNLGIYAICLAILSMALSISATHIFVALSFLFFLYRICYSFFAKHKYSTQKKVLYIFGHQLFVEIPQKIQKNPLLFFGGLYYLWLLLASLFHFRNDLSFLLNAFRFEISDFALYLFGLLIFAVSKKDQNSRYLIDKAFGAMAVLFILSGLLALFTEFRLGRLLSGHGFVASAHNRPQHELIQLFGIQLYRPVGFMNTHLTFGGLLLLSLPILFSDFIDKKRKLKKTFSRKALLPIGYFFLLLSGLVVLLANGARSVLLAALIFFPPLILALLKIRLFLLWKYMFGIGTLCLALFILGNFYVNNFQAPTPPLKGNATKDRLPNASLANAKKQIPLGFGIQKFQEKFRHTDYTRPIIWQGSWEVFLEHPFLGVGAGTFQKSTWKWREQYMQSHPRMLYFFKNTPDGHAHNDLLHIAVISGIPGVALFLFLIYLTGKEALSASLQSPNEKRRFVAYGLAGFFAAGLLQCYFQDDEVVILFWALVGRYFGPYQPEEDNKASS